MEREKFKKFLKTGGKVALLVAVIAIPAYAITRTNWVHPCANANDLNCLGFLGAPPCVCDGDFDNDNHWTFNAPNANIAIMDHSNASVTDEDFLRMAFTNETVAELRISTDDTGGNDDLDILFDDSATITVSGAVTLDATNGQLTLRVDSGGKIVTQ